MVRQAQAAGLYFDEECLPAETKRDPLAAQHDSSDGFFTVNHLLPTLREVCGKDFPIPTFQRLYRPIGADGQPVEPVNEAIHQSVVDRYARRAQFCISDDTGAADAKAYKPANLAPLVTAAGAPVPGIRVIPYA